MHWLINGLTKDGRSTQSWKIQKIYFGINFFKRRSYDLLTTDSLDNQHDNDNSITLCDL